jgi:hypothetical protein
VTATSAPHAPAVEYLAGHWPAEGGRHGAYLALAGGLVRPGGLPVEQAEAVVEALALATADEEVSKRVGLVRPTAEKVRRKEQATGWPRLAEILGTDGQSIVRAFRLKLGIVVSLAQLAEHKRLPVAFLESLGLHDLPLGGVGIPYWDAGGRTVATKERTALRAGDGSRWPKGHPPLAYGEEHLDAAVRAGYLSLVEGESDVWTLRYHDLPALGLPGADTVQKTLQLGHISPFQRIFVHQENDQGGEVFVDAVRHRLAALEWQGELRRTYLDPIKDPSALHCDDPARFKERWQQALDSAEVLPSLPPQSPGPPAPAVPTEPPWPEPPDEAAYHGLAGDVVRVITPHSEADKVALLVQMLVAFGNAIGRTAHFRAEGDTHYLNEFAVLMGKTSKGRKGSSWGHIRRLMEGVLEDWVRDRIQGGASSGEGLIWAVRDPIMARHQVKEKGRVVGYEEVEADPGVCDKRLLLYEPEFASVLKQLERQGNTLSTIIRQAWESGDIRSLTKNSPARATGAHVSILGHVTVEELRRYLSATESANGFGNRFMWFLVRRSKALPLGGGLPMAGWDELRERLRAALDFAVQVGEMCFDAEAEQGWCVVYEELSADRPGMSGAMLSRAEAHVRRLACLYALQDQSAVIRLPHLTAALALWEYVEASVHYVFGDSTGDPVADDILRALRSCPAGLTRDAIRDMFHRNRSSTEIGRALGVLLSARLAWCRREETGGRPAERWCAQRPTRERDKRGKGEGGTT